MDLEILKKKVSSYRSEGGHVKNVSDELLLEILAAWEQWTGSGSEFARSIGMHRHGISRLIGKAKKLRREGFPSGDFREIKIEAASSVSALAGDCRGIELLWDQGKIIRFPQVDQLIDFLKKVA